MPESPALEALIPPGHEDAVARMLGRGEMLVGSCRLAEGQIDRTFARGNYACGDDRVTLQLVHRSKAPDAALRTRDFGIVLAAGAPPPGLLESIAERVRAEEPRFEWLLETGPVASSAVETPGTRPWGGSPPAITWRQLALRVAAASAVLLLSSPWWYTRARES